MVIGWWSSLNRDSKYLPLCYRKIAALQKDLVYRKKTGSLNIDLVLLLEHSPTFTIGRRAWEEYQETSPNGLQTNASQRIELLLKTGAAFERSNRGGLITFHGPGQLVAYPILELGIWKPDMRWYVNVLQQSMIDLTKSIGIIGASTTDNVGIWLGQGQRKIASIGFHVDRWITSHGLSYNVDVDLNWFKHIIPCGLKDKTITSVVNERPDLNIDTCQVASMLLPCLERHLERKMVPLRELNSSLHNEIDHYTKS